MKEKEPIHRGNMIDNFHHDLTATADWVYLLAAVYTTAFTPVIRKGMGVRALSLLGPFALLWIVGYAEFAHCAALVVYLPFWLFACFVQTAILRDRRGRHSRFAGDRLLGRLEVPALLGAGMYLSTVDAALGDFVLGGAFSFIVRTMIDNARIRAMSLDVGDARAEAEWRAGMFR